MAQCGCADNPRNGSEWPIAGACHNRFRDVFGSINPFKPRADWAILEPTIGLEPVDMLTEHQPHVGMVNFEQDRESDNALFAIDPLADDGPDELFAAPKDIGIPLHEIAHRPLDNAVKQAGLTNDERLFGKEELLLFGSVSVAVGVIGRFGVEAAGRFVGSHRNFPFGL